MLILDIKSSSQIRKIHVLYIISQYVSSLSVNHTTSPSSSLHVFHLTSSAFLIYFRQFFYDMFILILVLALIALTYSSISIRLPFDAHCFHMDTAAIKHPVPDRIKPSFVIFDTRAL